MFPDFARLSLERKRDSVRRSNSSRRHSESTKAREYNWEKNPEFTPDRGAGFYEKERKRLHKPSLVESGKHAGRSRVYYKGGGSHQMFYHLWFRDFFTSVAHLKLKWVILALVLLYFAMFVVFACLYYLVDTIQSSCFDDETFDNSFVNYYIFSMATQQTIGYGVRSPNSCWIGALLISFHSVMAMLLDSIFLGIIFARISHPRRRGRSIFLSDCAVVGRRDGVLKFMFRLADVRPTTVMSPNVRCHMYTFGHGRKTAEGEFIPVRVQEMIINYIDGNMLLPVTVEHTIDERSPLYGHSRQTLEHMGTEIVVSFEGTNEFGDTFSAKQSYLPNEIHWGFMFSQTIFPCDGSQGTQHIVDLTKFHDVEPQREYIFQAGTAEDISRRVISTQAALGKIPSSLLGENTIVLSDCLCIMFRDGNPFLAFRVGDSYSHQLLEVHVRAFIYRWDEVVTQEGELINMQMQELTLEPNKLFLRYPCLVLHRIDENSPISKWVDPSRLAYDALSEIVVTVEGVQLISSSNIIKQKTYKVLSQIKYGYMFESMMIPPNKNNMGVGIVEWDKFHTTKRLKNMAVVNQLIKQEIHELEKAQSMERQDSSPLAFAYSRYHNLGSSLSYEDAQKESLKKERIAKKRSNSNPELLLMEKIAANQGRKKGLLYQLRLSGNIRDRRYSLFERPVSKPIGETSSGELDSNKQFDQMEKGTSLASDFSDQNLQIVHVKNEQELDTHSSETVQAPRSGELWTRKQNNDSASMLQDSLEADVNSRYQSEPVSLTALQNISSSTESSYDEAPTPIPLHDQHYYTYHSGTNMDWKNTRALNQIWSILEQNEETNDK